MKPRPLTDANRQAMPQPLSGLRDNHSRGTAGDFLRRHITAGTDPSFVSAYFTVHAYEALRDTLESAASLRFLFGEPSFVGTLDRETKSSRRFKLRDDGLQLVNQLAQFDSEVWKKLFAFQRDGVKGSIRRLRDFNGCILADSVGLGKTFQALAVIKYFLLRNERVLVLCPQETLVKLACLEI